MTQTRFWDELWSNTFINLLDLIQELTESWNIKMIFFSENDQIFVSTIFFYISIFNFKIISSWRVLISKTAIFFILFQVRCDCLDDIYFSKLDPQNFTSDLYGSKYVSRQEGNLNFILLRSLRIKCSGRLDATKFTIS